jgi:membrane protease YdiL (CAAX protease family)
LGVTDRPLNIAWHLFAEPGRLAFLLLLSFVFPAIEEIGLRGYYLDVLQERFNTTAAGLINGAIWAIWHAPFVYFPGYYANTTFNPSLYWWLPMIVFTTLLIVQVYNHTQQCILAVSIFHGMMNFTGEVLGISASMYPFILSGYALLGMLLVLIWQCQKTGSIPSRQDGAKRE